jgi:hypothetical protein
VETNETLNSSGGSYEARWISQVTPGHLNMTKNFAATGYSGLLLPINLFLTSNKEKPNSQPYPKIHFSSRLQAHSSTSEAPTDFNA